MAEILRIQLTANPDSMPMPGVYEAVLRYDIGRGSCSLFVEVVIPDNGPLAVEDE